MTSKKYKTSELNKMVSLNTNVPIYMVRDISKEMFETIAEILESGDSVHINNFGKFETIVSKPTEKYIPSLDEKKLISSRNVPKFRPSQGFKKKLN